MTTLYRYLLYWHKAGIQPIIDYGLPFSHHSYVLAVARYSRRIFKNIKIYEKNLKGGIKNETEKKI